MLKLRISAKDHEKLPADVKSEYKPEGEGFILDLDGYEDLAALKRAKDHEKEQRKAAEKLAKDIGDQLATLTEERDGLLKGAIPKGDVEKLEGSYKKKLADRETELNTRINSLNGQLQTMLVDNVATSLASEISTAPAVILPHIRARLKAEEADGKLVTRIIDADGKPTALTVDDLKKEFLANKAFAPILTGSRASGGGAGGGGGGGGATGGNKIDFSKSPKEIAAQIAARGSLPDRPGGT